MKDVSATLLAAIQNTSQRVKVRFEFSESRAIISSVGDDSSPAWALASGVSDTPIPEDMAYFSDVGGYVTTLSYNGNVYYMTEGNSTPIQLESPSGALLTAQESKPAIREGYVYYINDSLSKLYECPLNNTSVASRLVQAATGENEVLSGISSGAIAAIDDRELVLFEITGGGVEVSHIKYDSGWQVNTRAAKIMIEDTCLTDDYLAVYTAAVKFGDDIFAYFTSPNGNVLGVKLDSSGNWSDVFEAVPADLSGFAVTNAIVSNNAIHLAGQFYRDGDFANGITYCMAVKSTDGYTFSMDRFSLFAILGYRFFIDIRGDNLYICGTNRISSTPATYRYIASPVSKSMELSDEAVEISGDTQNLSVSIADVDESLISNSMVRKGNRVKFYIQFQTSVGWEEILYGTYIIDQINYDYVERDIDLDLASEASWKLYSSKLPYYVEMQGVSALSDPVSDLSYLYIAPNGGAKESKVILDFWDTSIFDNGRATLVDLTAGTTRVLTGRISKRLDLLSIPDISSVPITISIYYWASNENTDTVPTVSPVIVVEDESGVERTIDSGFSLTSGSPHCPETYNNTVTGSYPVTYTLSTPDIELGEKIVQVGFDITSPGDATAYYERIEIDGVTATYTMSNTNTPWSITDDADGAEVPNFGQPYLMFATSPYTSNDFIVTGEFEFNGSYASFGLVGFASDAEDFVCAKYLNGVLYISKYRSGFETVLASVVTTFSSGDSMMFSHSGGTFYVRRKNAGVWSDILLSYEWQESDGALSVSADDACHTGVFGEISPPSFYVAPFNISNSEGICVYPGQGTDVLDSWPSSGQVMINNVVYSYQSKTGNGINGFGPFQGFNSNNWPSGCGDNHGGLACDISWLKWNGAESAYSNYLFSITGGNTSIVDHTLWRPGTLNGGVLSLLPNRSRWYLPNLEASVGHDLKCYVGQGLKSIAVVDGDSESHMAMERAFLYSDDFVRIKKFSATNKSSLVTLKDFLNKIARQYGVSPEFGGDNEIASIALTADVEYTL